MSPRAALPIAVALLIAGCGSSGATDTKPAASRPAASSPARTFPVHGSLTLTLGQFSGDPDNLLAGCAGEGGYDDLHAGTSVTVTDAAGATIGLGKLGQGFLNPGASTCSFSFNVTNIPAGKGFYGVEVSRRGRVQYPEADLVKDVVLSIG